MVADQAVIFGMGVVFAGLLSISYILNESKQALFNYLGILFLALSIGVLQMVGWAVIQIAIANNMTYLTTGLIQPFLWVVNIAMFSFWITLAAKALWYMITSLFTWFSETFGGQVSDND